MDRARGGEGERRMLTDGWSQAGSFPSWRELCVCGSGCHGNEHRNAKLKTKLAPHRARVCVCVWGNKRNYPTK